MDRQTDKRTKQNLICFATKKYLWCMYCSSPFPLHLFVGVLFYNANPIQEDEEIVPVAYRLFCCFSYLSNLTNNIYFWFWRFQSFLWNAKLWMKNQQSMNEEISFESIQTKHWEAVLVPASPSPGSSQHHKFHHNCHFYRHYTVLT